MFKWFADALGGIYNVIYAVQAEVFHIYSVVPAVCLFLLFFAAVLFPLVYQVQKETVFKPFLDTKTADIRSACERDVKHLTDAGEDPLSDTVIRRQLQMERDVKKIRKSYHVTQGFGKSLWAVRIFLVILTWGMLASLPAYMPRLQYIYKNLTAYVTEYGYSNTYVKVTGVLPGSNLKNYNALYRLTPKDWDALSSGMDNLQPIVDGVRKGSARITGIGGISLGAAPLEDAKDGYPAAILFAVLTEILFLPLMLIRSGSTSGSTSKLVAEKDRKVFARILLLCRIASAVFSVWIMAHLSAMLCLASAFIGALQLLSDTLARMMAKRVLRKTILRDKKK